MTESTEPEQIRIMRRLIEMSAERNYHNAERTLAVWIRTALALMIFGIAIDQFGLFLRQAPQSQARGLLNTSYFSSWGGAALIALGVLMAASTGARFFAFSVAYKREHAFPAHHGPHLGAVFALLVTLFGIALLVTLSVFTA